MADQRQEDTSGNGPRTPDYAGAGYRRLKPLSWFLIVLLTILFSWGLRLATDPHCDRLTIFLDQASGLQAGDAVYLKGIEVGQVEDLEIRGRRVAIDLSISCEHRGLVSEESEFYLWQDERQPERKSLKVSGPRLDDG